MTAAHPVERWHALIAARDPSQLAALLAEDVVFYSPVLHTPQRGKQLTTMYLTGAFHVLLNEHFRYVHELTADGSAMLEFESKLDEIYINGVDLIRFDASGKITEFKVMVRPLKGIQTLQAKMRELLERLPPSAKPSP